ncbi:SDR family oxidoreductase [Zavarzinia sp. CC-PAN008]|uniref:SDR family oxidoreductase n=1 Tax=Zavarzinia sp. CC-PAN008 TaxID=3243332 RepID=UPI003F74A889
MFLPDLLKDRRILVTGGGTGLGAAMARRFAGLGATLILCGRRQAVLDETAAAIAAESGRPVTALPCDIRDPDAVEALAERIWQDGPLDVLVNNAAGNFIAQTEHLSARAADAILNTSMHGALYCTLAAGKRWIGARHPGIVLSILSTSTLTGRAFTVPSAMAKSGLLAMTRSLAVEWGPKGVRLVAIAPGPFPTAGAWQQLRPGESPAQKHAPGNPLGRVGEHHELADLAAFLVSPMAGYINGEMVTIDGGLHLRQSGAEDLLAWTDDQWAALRAKRS